VVNPLPISSQLTLYCEILILIIIIRTMAVNYHKNSKQPPVRRAYDSNPATDNVYLLTYFLSVVFWTLQPTGKPARFFALTLACLVRLQIFSFLVSGLQTRLRPLAFFASPMQLRALTYTKILIHAQWTARL